MSNPAKIVMAVLLVATFGLLAFAPKSPPCPTVVAGAMFTVNGGNPWYHVYRFWSDGTVDVTYQEFLEISGPSGCDLAYSCGPVVVIPVIP